MVVANVEVASKAVIEQTEGLANPPSPTTDSSPSRVFCISLELEAQVPGNSTPSEYNQPNYPQFIQALQ